MDIVARPADWMIGRSCEVCDFAIEPADRVAYDLDGDGQRVRHLHCESAVQHGRADELRLLAVDLQALGVREPELLFLLRARAQAIEDRMAQKLGAIVREVPA